MVVSLLAATLGPAWAAPLPFTDGSFGTIVRAHQGKPFVLVFWSVDCPPCIKELGTLTMALKRHPDMALVLVSTDDTAARPRIEEILNKHGLQQVESWIFADSQTRRLRDQVDANWYGELPRSYLFDAQHRRVPLSGEISAEQLEAWLQSNRH